MFSLLGSQSKNWTRGKLKHSPNGVKSISFLSHLSSTSLSSQYSLCLSHLSTCSLSHFSSTSLFLISADQPSPFSARLRHHGTHPYLTASPSRLHNLHLKTLPLKTYHNNIPQHRKNHKLKKNQIRNCFQP